MLIAALILATQTLLAAPCDLVGVTPIVTDLSNVTSCGEACGQKKPGAKAFVSEWYNANEGEGNSTGNRITGNDRGSLYEKSKKAKKFHEKRSNADRGDVTG